jgi:hypothetical protein
LTILGTVIPCAHSVAEHARSNKQRKGFCISTLPS